MSVTCKWVDLVLITPHICHLDHLYIGGEKSVMWRNFRFQCMTDVEKFEISPHAEEFQLFPHNRCGKMWNFAKFGGILHISTWQMWRNPKFTLFCCCKICFVTNYAVFAKSVLARFTRGEKLSQKFDRWRKNDKYEVWDIANNAFSLDQICSVYVPCTTSGNRANFNIEILHQSHKFQTCIFCCTLPLNYSSKNIEK